MVCMNFNFWKAQCLIEPNSNHKPESRIFGVILLPYSRGKYSWGPNFILFVFSLSERKFNTQNMRYDGRVFLCKMDRTKIKHTDQMEIAQNEIWTPQKFPAIQYLLIDDTC